MFDTGYTPETEEEKQLFAKQEFVYSMFNRCVQTDTGKSIVRSHEVDFDAQAVYSKLVNTVKKSTKAQLTRDKLVTDLTTNKLDSSWKGTHEGFVLMWKEKMRLLEDISPQLHHYSTEVKLSMLQNAVSIVPKLSSIQDISNNLVAIGNDPSGYQAYSELLISGCNQLDNLASSNQEAGRDDFFDAVDTNPDAPASATMPRENSLLATIQEPLSLRQLLANTHHTAPAVAPTTSDNRTVVIDGKRYIETNTHRIQYRFNEAAGINHRKGISALVDRGANSGLAGEDVRVLEHTLSQADISGIDNHTMFGLPIVCGRCRKHPRWTCLRHPPSVCTAGKRKIHTFQSSNGMP